MRLTFNRRLVYRHHTRLLLLLLLCWVQRNMKSLAVKLGNFHYCYVEFTSKFLAQAFLCETMRENMKKILLRRITIGDLCRVSGESRDILAAAWIQLGVSCKKKRKHSTISHDRWIGRAGWRGHKLFSGEVAEATRTRRANRNLIIAHERAWLTTELAHELMTHKSAKVADSRLAKKFSLLAHSTTLKIDINWWKTARPKIEEKKL